MDVDVKAVRFLSAWTICAALRPAVLANVQTIELSVSFVAVSKSKRICAPPAQDLPGRECGR